jgi:phenylalanyl-tRNA synthetase beta chain
MKTTLTWLQEHLTFHLESSKIINAFNDLSIEIDEITKIGGEFYVVYITHIRPYGDRLSICTVEYFDNDSNKIIKEVLCGASNARIGIFTVMAMEGALLANNIILKKRTILNFESNAMLLSYKEFGLDHLDTNGIIEDTTDTFLKYLIKEDFIFNINLPANRIDLNSCRGIAQELSSYFNVPMKPLHTNTKQATCQHNVNVQIDHNLTTIFTSMIIKNIQVKDNYYYILSLLAKITNILPTKIINISNYILFDLGIPIHIYDLNIENLNKVHVTLLKEKEEIITLQEKKILLQPNDIVIQNQNGKTMVLAGIIGTENFKCVNTENIFIEAAIFNREYIIPTQRRLNLHTMSSTYFARGINYYNYLMVMSYIKNFIDGDFSDMKIINNHTTIQKNIFLSHDTFYKKSHITISLDKIANLLKQYQYQVKIINKNNRDQINNEMGLEITPPLWKNYIENEGSLVEEIIRIGGLMIPKQKLPPFVKKHDNTFFDNLIIIKELAVYHGYKEIMTTPFVLEGEIELVNPIVQQYKYMRSNLQEHIIAHLNLINTKKLGIDYNNKIFEINKVFIKNIIENDIEEYTNLIFGISENIHHYGTLFMELELKNILYILSDTFIWQLELKKNTQNINMLDIIINNSINGYILFSSIYIIGEIFNLGKLLDKKSQMYIYKKNISVIEDYTIRDYSFTAEINTYEKILENLKNITYITYSIFDKFQESCGIRIKFYNFTQEKEDYILNIFSKLNITLR